MVKFALLLLQLGAGEMMVSREKETRVVCMIFSVRAIKCQ